MQLVTKAEYDKMNARAQGFAQYWEGERVGSELKDLKNPYPVGTKDHKEWHRGQQLAVQQAQDSEE